MRHSTNLAILSIHLMFSAADRCVRACEEDAKEVQMNRSVRQNTALCSNLRAPAVRHHVFQPCILYS